MRTTTLTTLLAALALVACSPDPDANDSEILVQVTGQLERSADQTTWYGTEIVRVIDVDGFLVCDGSLSVEGIEDPVNPPCDGCDLTLEAIRSEVRALGADCVREYELDRWTVDFSGTLNFIPDQNGKPLPLGSVWFDLADGSRTHHADGLLYEDSLAYQNIRTWVSP